MKTKNRQTLTSLSAEKLEGRWIKDLHQRDVIKVKLQEAYPKSFHRPAPQQYELLPDAVRTKQKKNGHPNI